MIAHGLLLAAGAGTRMGRPKALVVGADGEAWLARGVRALREGGCADVTVVLGAAADDAAALVPPGVTTVVAEGWADGMSASLRTGLAAVDGTAAEVAVVSLVDLPDVGPEVVRRVLDAGADAGTLSRATYDGRPGHPVVIGRDHWPGVLETTRGDAGARDYLATHEVTAVECGDLASGRDVDTRGG